MISEEAYETLRAFADLVFQRELGAVRHRVDLRNAIGELRLDREQAQKLTAALADPAENVRQLRADRRLVDEAVRRHAVEMLKASVHRPQAGELFPAEPFAQAQWHLLRITALNTAPLDLAAAQLREEAHAALDTNPKEAKE